MSDQSDQRGGFGRPSRGGSRGRGGRGGGRGQSRQNRQGQGRGQRRLRGQGHRGRNSRGRGRGGFGARTSQKSIPTECWCTDEGCTCAVQNNVDGNNQENIKQEEKRALDIDRVEDLKELFVGTEDFEQHYTAQERNCARYMAAVAVLENNGVELSANAKVRALAAAWARHDQTLSRCLLSRRDRCGLVEVLKALTLLDAGRRIREEEKKLKRMQMQTTDMIKPKVMGMVKSNLDNLARSKPKCGSASGAVCRHVRQWVKSFTKEELEYYALHFPTEPWCKLADICHLHPKKDFPALDWFLPFCYGSPAPEGSTVAKCRDVTADNVNDLLQEFHMPFSHVKPHCARLSDWSKGKIAATDKLEQVIWWYEDLQCPDVDDVISQRLESGETLTLSYGKLMERLLTFKLIREQKLHSGWRVDDWANEDWGWDGQVVEEQEKKDDEGEKEVEKAKFISQLIPVAEKRLKEISLSLEAPVVVMGDRSPSMDTAIRTSTIIASLLTAICSAKLVFFDDTNMDAPFIPNTIPEVLEMAATMRTGSGTSPAVSLWPFYERKEVVKTFIVVTDEEENGGHEGYWFADLFKKYREEVYPAKLVFVTFLHYQLSEGQMVNSLKDIGITDNVMQFKFDASRPDLTKLDKMFGLLSSETESFEEQVKQVEAEIQTKGMLSVFK